MLIVIVFVLAGLIAWRWSLGAVTAVATGQPSQMVTFLVILALTLVQRRLLEKRVNYEI